MDTVSSNTGNLSQVRCKNLEEYANAEEIMADAEILAHENFILSQTAEVLERYLRKRSPAMIAGLEKFMERASHSVRTSIQPSGRSMSLNSSKSFTSPADTANRSSTTSSMNKAITSRSNAQSGSSYRISTAAKADMVEREVEESRMTIDRLQRKFESAKFLLETEEENLREDIEFLEECRIALEDTMCKSLDKKSGRFFQDKLMRFLERELQANDRFIRKIKLKAKALQTEYRRLHSQQQQRLELRERLHPIDIEKLLIENEERLDTLEQKSKTLQDLKKAVGKKGQSVVGAKSKLNDTIHTLKNLKQGLEQKRMKCKYMEEQEEQYEDNLKAVDLINQNIKELNLKFKSTDVHSYLQVQSNLEELKSEHKTWQRRCKYQNQQIALLEHQVKQLSSPRARNFSLRVRSQSPDLRSTIVNLRTQFTPKSEC